MPFHGTSGEYDERDVGDLEFVRLKKMKKKTVNRAIRVFHSRRAVPLRVRRGTREKFLITEFL